MIYMGDSCERNADVPREFWEHVPEQDWVRGDFTAWIKVKRGGLYPQERQVQVRMFGVRFAKSDAEAMGADFTFADPAVMSGSVMAAEPNPQSMEDRYRQLAKELDDEGMPIRSVSVKTIQARWSSADGPAPLVKTVTGYMDGGGRGGRPKGG
jgi:hypothetical protein